MGVDDGLAAAYAHRVLGMVERMVGRWEQAQEHFATGTECADRCGEALLAIEIGMHRAMTMARADDLPGARALIDRLLVEARPYPQAIVWMSTFQAWFHLGDQPQRSRRVLAELEPAARNREDHWTVAWCLVDRAVDLLVHGPDDGTPDAARTIGEALDRFRRIRNRTEVVSRCWWRPRWPPGPDGRTRPGRWRRRPRPRRGRCSSVASRATCSPGPGSPRTSTGPPLG